jgi:TonB family protein
MMKGFDQRVFLRISGAHAGILLLMLVVPWFKGCFRPKPKEMIIFMDLAASMPAPDPVPAPVPDPKPEPLPAPKPAPKPLPVVTNTPPRPKPPPPAKTQPKVEPKPPPKPETKPAPPPTPAPRKETEAERLAKIRQNTPVHRPAPAPSAPSLDLSGLRAALNTTATGTGSGAGGGGVYSPFAGYYETVKQRMYAVWQQPAGAPIGLTATAVIRVERDGSVSMKSITRRSGHPAFDQSVQNALNATVRLPAPPADLPDRNISIEFMLSN